MPRIQRPIKFQLCLTPEEKQLVQQKAKDMNVSVSELFRSSALSQKLPVSKINAQTYWELGKIGTNLNQMSYALNTAIKLNQPIPRELKEVNQTLKELSQLVNQIRKELID